MHPGLPGPRRETVFCPCPPPQSHCKPGRETPLSMGEQHVSLAAGCPRGPEEGHPPSDRSTVPISKGMTSSGKTPLSPTMSEPRREQIQVSSLSPLSRAPQDSLSLLSRRQAAAAPRFRRACWEPPAPPRSSRATAVRKRSLWPAIPQPEQGHPGMPGAEKHKGHLHKLPPLAEHLLMKYGILTFPTHCVPQHLPSSLPGPGLWGSKWWVHRAKVLCFSALQGPHIFSFWARFRLCVSMSA